MTNNCLICNKPFAVKPCFAKKGRGKYCSVQCYYISLKGKTFFKGKKHTKESKEKMSLARIGKRQSPATEFKKGKYNKNKIEEARKKASLLINALTDYSQRCELALVDKSRMVLKFSDDKVGELMACPGESYLFFSQEIKKITDRVYDSTIEEATNAIEQRKVNRTVNVNPNVFDLIKKEFGDFEIIL